MSVSNDADWRRHSDKPRRTSTWNGIDRIDKIRAATTPNEGRKIRHPPPCSAQVDFPPTNICTPERALGSRDEKSRARIYTSTAHDISSRNLPSQEKDFTFLISHLRLVSSRQRRSFTSAGTRLPTSKTIRRTVSRIFGALSEMAIKRRPVSLAPTISINFYARFSKFRAICSPLASSKL